MGRPLSPEHKAKISVALLQYRCSPEYKARPPAANVGRPLSEEHKAKISAARRGRPLSEEHKAKISAGLFGRKMAPRPPVTEATRQKMSAARKGKPHKCKRPAGRVVSELTKQKLAVINKGKSASAETRAKMSATRAGVRKSDSTRASMSLAQKSVSPETQRRRSEATSRSNAQRQRDGRDFNVKGYYESTKAVPSRVPYRSTSIELRIMQALDADSSVQVWTSPWTVEYIDSRGARRWTLPDIMVTAVDGSRRVIEGKSPHLLAAYKAGEKFAAVRQWCVANGIAFDLITTMNRCQTLVTERIVVL